MGSAPEEFAAFLAAEHDIKKGRPQVGL